MCRVFQEPDSGTDVKRHVVSYAKGGGLGSPGEQTPRFAQEMSDAPLGNYSAMLPWMF